ncbi:MULTISPECIES: hypothetical protein [unclassified Kribbella]|uniref:hypothetical protein n=1 Tax=unclassified Kribbella TaxID=2644121 RepID=UPI0033E1E50D
MADPERVTRSALAGHIKPISRPRRLPILPRRVWSDEDWQRIQLGYASQDMDEKWNVFAEGDVVFVHRSWTGLCVYEATFRPVGGGWQISKAVVPRKRSGAIRRLLSGRSRGDNEFKCVMLELVLSAIVLGEPAQELRAKLVKLMRARSREANLSAGLIEHSLLGLRSAT